MSAVRGFSQNGAKYFTNITKPQIVSCNFVVDSTNGNGLGIRSLKSNGYIESILMATIAGQPAGTLNLGTSRLYGVLAASTTTAAGSSTITGNLGLYPGTAITGYPPSTVSGVVNATNVAAQQARAAALAAYTAGKALPAGTTEGALDGLTLTPGVYTSGSTMSLAASGAGTLILNGLGVYIFQIGSTLITGTGGTPTITLSGGARAEDIYWLVGSSATINDGHGGTFYGNVIAHDSITVTTAGTVNGSLIALNAAVTLTGNIAVNAVPLAPISAASNPAPGYCVVKFKNNFNKYIGGFSGFVSPLNASNIVVTAAGAHLVVGQPYVIVSTGTSTLADWNAIGLYPGFTPAVGQSFIATATGAGTGSGVVRTPAVSGINSVEVIGDPNVMIANSSVVANAGAIILLQFLSNGVPSAPVDGSVVGMQFQFDGSTVSIPDAPGQTGL